MRNNEIIVFCNYPTKSKHYVAKVGYTSAYMMNQELLEKGIVDKMK